VTSNDGVPKRLSLPDSWIIGWLEIDEGHQTILRQINDCLGAMDAGRVTGFIARLQGLYEMFEAHFVEEERLMADVGYAGLPSHMAHHAGVLESLATLLEQCRLKGFAGPEDIAFCFDNLLSDIVNVDLNFKAFGEQRGLISP